jgi:hypothetical protein
MGTELPLVEFTCAITFESIRPPKPVITEEDGVTYVVQRDYEIAFSLTESLTADHARSQSHQEWS